MPTPFESAQLNLKLFELRREPVLRQAREWFLLDFHPESFDEMMSIVAGPHNTKFRMVLSYWDMAASLVTTGAIDADAFLAAHGEIFGTFCKIQPYLAEFRASRNDPGVCKHLEAAVMHAPDALDILGRRREILRAAYARRQSAAKSAG